jgi:hypothetical protein
MAISTTAKIKISHAIFDKSIIKDAINTGINALNTPNKIAPIVFESIRTSSGIGASRSLSKERFFFSNVTVTESRDVVPNRIDSATTPGKIESIPERPVPDFIKNIPVHARGKMIPQLIFGGFR